MPPSNHQDNNHRNGEAAPDDHGGGSFPTAPAPKLRYINGVLRFATFCFSLSSAIFMATNYSLEPSSPSWLDHHPFRAVFAANAIVAAYSAFESGASMWEILRGATLLPEALQLWFDFSHDQIFAYMMAAAMAAGAVEAAALRRTEGVRAGGFCVQSVVSLGLGFGGFVFLAVTALVSAFRVGFYVFTGHGNQL